MCVVLLPTFDNTVHNLLQRRHSSGQKPDKSTSLLMVEGLRAQVDDCLRQHGTELHIKHVQNINVEGAIKF